MDKATSDSIQPVDNCEHELQSGQLSQETDNIVHSSIVQQTTNLDLKPEKASHKDEAVTSQSTSSSNVERHDSDDRNLTPLRHSNTHSTGAYFIRKVSSGIKAIKSSPIGSFGKVLILPKQPASNFASSPAKHHNVYSQQNQSGIFIANSEPQPQTSQVCDKIVMQPSFRHNMIRPFQMTHNLKAATPMHKSVAQNIQLTSSASLSAARPNNSCTETLPTTSSDDCNSRPVIPGLKQTYSKNESNAAQQNVQADANSMITGDALDKVLSENNSTPVEAGKTSTIADSEGESHQSLSEKIKGYSTSVPQYFRDIRQSVSNFIFGLRSPNYRDQVQDANTSTAFHTGVLKNPNLLVAERSTNNTQSAIQPILKVKKQCPEASLKIQESLKNPGQACTSGDCKSTQDCQAITPLDSAGMQEIKSSQKLKRKPKPKQTYSPSGNHDFESSFAPENRQIKEKPSRKRKTTKEGFDTQYFDALHRTIAKKAKCLNTDSRGHIETSFLTTKVKAPCRKPQSSTQDSDYKLKRKKLLLSTNNKPVSNETINSHHLLKKIDPNDPERRKSLAIFSKTCWGHESNTKPDKLSTNISGKTFAVSSTNTSNLELNNGLDSHCESSNTLINEEAVSLKSVRDIPQKTYKLSESYVTEKDNGYCFSGDKSRVKELSPVVKSEEQEKRMKCIETDKTRNDKDSTNKPTSSSHQCNAPLGIIMSSNSPSVVLQRLSGITPTKTVYLSHTSKEAHSSASSEKRDEILHSYAKDKQDNTEIAIDNKINDINIIKTGKKISPQSVTVTQYTNISNVSKGQILSGNSVNEWNINADTNDSLTGRYNKTKTIYQRENSPLKGFHQMNKYESEELNRQQEEGILQQLLFNDSKSEKDNSQHFKIAEGMSIGNYREHVETTESAQLKVQSKVTDLDVLDKINTEEHTKSISDKNIIVNKSCNVDETFTQPVPGFFNKKGYVLSGPMPITTETCRYLLSKGAAGNSLLPRPNFVQHIHENSSRIITADHNIANYPIMKSFKIVSEPAEIKDPTGILKITSQGQLKAVKNNLSCSKGKTVAELLSEKRKQQSKEQNLMIKSSTELINAPSKLTGGKKQVCNMRAREEKAPVASSKDRTIIDEVQACTSAASLMPFQTVFDIPEKSVTNVSIINSPESKSKQTRLKEGKSSLALSPLAYSKSSAITGRVPSEIAETPTIKENDISEKLKTSTCILIPSPNIRHIGKPSPSIKQPITMQTVAGMHVRDSYSPSNPNTDTVNKTNMVNEGSETFNTNKSFAIRIGDKMYIIRPSIPAEQANTKSVDSKKPLESLPDSKVLKPRKSSKKLKSPASTDKRGKMCLTTHSPKEMKKNLKKMLRKNKTPFEELIQSLGLEQSKEKAKKCKRKAAYKITYSSTPSPVPSTHNSVKLPVSLKQEPATPESNTISDANSVDRIPDNQSSKPHLKAGKVDTKKATIMQIFKVENKSTKFYVHNAKVKFTEGSNSSYHRWFPHSDYPCTLHLKNSDMIYQIDTECLLSGFYLISEMDRNILTENFKDITTVNAVLSLYPPDIHILPDESLSIVVGQLSNSDESEQPIPNRNESDDINQNIDRIIKSILKLDTFKDIDWLEDRRYGSVKRVCMSPKYHSSQFYTQQLFDCFTPDRKTDLKSFFGPKNTDCSLTLKSVPSKDKLEEFCEADASLHKAQELKVKQTELYEKCTLLKEQLQTAAGLLRLNDVVRDFDLSDEIYTDISQDNKSNTMNGFLVPASETIPSHKVEKVELRGRRKKVSDKQVDIKTFSNKSDMAEKKRLQQKSHSNADTTPSRRLTRSLSVSSNLDMDSK